MTRRHPPRLADLLLTWLAPDDEALHGDLAEEFDAGRSRAWYWRQTLAAVASVETLTMRARGIAGIESVLSGVVMLILLGFYVTFVVNVTDWLFRFEGVDVLRGLPGLLTAWDGAAPMATLVAGLGVGRLISVGHARHRVVSIVLFGALTMGCAVAAMQAVDALRTPGVFLPSVVHQVSTTAAFVAGLLGGLGSSLMARPVGLSLVTRLPRRAS